MVAAKTEILPLGRGLFLVRARSIVNQEARNSLYLMLTNTGV